MINIGIDADGGDNGSLEVIKAVVDTIDDNNINFTIFGNQNNLINYFVKLNFDYKKHNINFVDCSDIIEMNDHPVFAIRNKTNSSICKAGNGLLNNNIDIFISAGSSGALVALAQFYLKPIKGIDRPAIAAVLPTKQSPMLLIDSGCNIDSKPEWLYQYSVIANEYYKLMFNCEHPSIGLLSVGTEENKGNNLTLETYKLIKNNTNLNFIGNVEARDLPFGRCNIIISDGFSGNVFLKTYEGTAKLLIDLIKENLKSSIIGLIAGVLIKSKLKNVFKKYDAKVYGGAPILGANYVILKCHGNATSTEYKYAIKQAENIISSNLISKLKNSFEV